MKRIFVVDGTIFLEYTAITIEQVPAQDELHLFTFPGKLSEKVGDIIMQKYLITRRYAMEDLFKGHRDPVLCQIGHYGLFYNNGLHLIPPDSTYKTLDQVGNFNSIRTKWNIYIIKNIINYYSAYIFIVVTILTLYQSYGYWFFGLDMDRKNLLLQQWR